MVVINRHQSLFKNLLTVKDWTFDIEVIKSYLLKDADTAHIGFAFSDMLRYTLYNVVERRVEFQGG